MQKANGRRQRAKGKRQREGEGSGARLGAESIARFLYVLFSPRLRVSAWGRLQEYQVDWISQQFVSACAYVSRKARQNGIAI